MCFFLLKLNQYTYNPAAVNSLVHVTHTEPSFSMRNVSRWNSGCKQLHLSRDCIYITQWHHSCKVMIIIWLYCLAVQPWIQHKHTATMWIVKIKKLQHIWKLSKKKADSNFYNMRNINWSHWANFLCFFTCATVTSSGRIILHWFIRGRQCSPKIHYWRMMNTPFVLNITCLPEGNTIILLKQFLNLLLLCLIICIKSMWI